MLERPGSNSDAARLGRLPVPESEDLGRYLEDTITIDWQTPAVMEHARALLENLDSPIERLSRLFNFVRDDVAHSGDQATARGADGDPPPLTCRASEVLEHRTGLCYAKSHLLAAFLRVAGFPTGFCYVRLAAAESGERFVLHGFNAVYWQPTGRWIFLDARGNNATVATECRVEEPPSLAYRPDADSDSHTDSQSDSQSERAEAFLPFIYRRPGKRVLDLLERAPDLATALRNLPDAL